ncbi:MAG: EAL domain-containing protein, partial [Nitratireductor sp.]|nr:EAL domain-containing protein [Nitratireductor sp.]
GSTVEAGEFLPLAERLGFMRIVDSCALDLAMDTLQTFPNARMSINVSNASAEDPDWLSKLAMRLRSAPDIAPRLIVEITESHAAADLGETRKFVSLLKDIGCMVAVDDFGAGYTSFSNLKALPIDIIKIDGSFARNLPDDRQNQVFIRSLLDLAGAFGVKTVVEWVENDATARLLASWGVDFLQGHRYGHATTACPFITNGADPQRRAANG